MITKFDLAMDRLVNRATVEGWHYRWMFRFDFWRYIDMNGFKPVEVSQKSEAEIDAMWEMFMMDAR